MRGVVLVVSSAERVEAIAAVKTATAATATTGAIFQNLESSNREH